MIASKLLTASLLVATAAAPMLAQDGRPASKVASPAPDNPFSINTEAWDSFVSLDGQRILGDPDQHRFIPAVTYFTSYTVSGKRIAKSTAVPSFTTTGPMFGGQGYLTLRGVLPFDSDETAQFTTDGGWKYHLFEWLDINAGGGLAFYDQDSFGEGQPTPFGSWYRSKIYAGLIGRIVFNPAGYVVYDSELEQVNFVTGLSEEYEINDELSIFGEARFGYASSSDYLGNTTVFTGKWKNSYAYWLTSADLKWTPLKGLAVTAGLGYTGNNDGSTGILLIDLGPENTLYGKFSVSYAF